MNTSTRILSLVVFLCAARPVFAAEPLLAGLAVGNISPDTTKYHVPLGGYGERQNAPATGIHDYALVKALMLKQGDTKVAFVFTDLQGIVRSLRDEVLARIEKTGITSDSLMLMASHCHASTEMNAMNRNNVFNNKGIGVYDEALLIFHADQIANAIIASDASLEPVNFGVTSLKLEGLNRNRRQDPVVDNEMTIARFDKTDGSTLAVFVNWTAHPTYMSEKVMQLSAGWPGYMQREIEAFMPGAACLYTNGAEGDIGPASGEGPSEFAKAEDYGRKIAIKVLENVKGIKTEANAALAFHMHMLDLPERAAPPALLDSAGPEYGLTPENVMVLVDAMVPESSYMGVLRIGDLVGVGIPGEMTSVLGLKIKDALAEAGAKHPIILGLSNEWISYMLEPEEYTQGGYEPGVSFYGPELGPVVVKQGIEVGTAILK